MPERIVALSQDMSGLVKHKVGQIGAVTRKTRMLALNALIESTRAAEHGKGFAVVAREVREISDTINTYVSELMEQLESKTGELNSLGSRLVGDLRGGRLADLSLNMIDIIDRNLYERSCDVRWWATDSAVVDCCTTPKQEACEYASARLGVILDAYTVYLDLWIVDRQGKVLANGRPGKYRQAVGSNVQNEPWFRDALHTTDGGQFAVMDVSTNGLLDGQKVATYSAAIRRNGEPNGEVIGVLGVFFDWEKQSQTVVDSVRLTADEKNKTRCMLLDSNFRVIASTGGKGVLTETFELRAAQKQGGYDDGKGHYVGYAQTIGYETYAGLGWYGVIVQEKT